MVTRGSELEIDTKGELADQRRHTADHCRKAERQRLGEFKLWSHPEMNYQPDDGITDDGPAMPADSQIGRVWLLSRVLVGILLHHRLRRQTD